MTGPIVPASYQALIESPRVSTRTRDVLQARKAADDPGYRPAAMTPAQLEILRSVMQRVIPQPADARIDLAARLDAQLGEGNGDGWRVAILPDDVTAAALGLDDLDAHARGGHGAGFTDLSASLQDEILARAAAGNLDGRLGGAQMRRWFEDLLAGAVQLYVAHPATLARMNYSGIACAGDGHEKHGFNLVGLGEREAWEPPSHPVTDAL